MFNTDSHDKLQKEVIEWLKSLGWMVGENTYHEVFSEEMTDLLRNQYNYTSFYVRGRGDCVAAKEDRCVLFEFKTNPTSSYNIPVEVLPLAHNYRSGAEYYYVMRQVVHKETHCVHIKDVFKCVNEIRYNSRHKKWIGHTDQLNIILDKLSEYYPGSIFSDCPFNGSGDPFSLLPIESYRKYQISKDTFK